MRWFSIGFLVCTLSILFAQASVYLAGSLLAPEAYNFFETNCTNEGGTCVHPDKCTAELRTKQDPNLLCPPEAGPFTVCCWFKEN